MNDTKRTFLTVIGGIVTVVVIAVLFINATDDVKGYNVGSVAEDFKLPNVDGKMVSMADYEDAKGFIVIFTCNTCPYAKMYESRIIDLDKQFASKGFPVIAINPNDVNAQPDKSKEDDSMEDMRKRSDKKGYTFPYLRDDSQEVAARFGATKTPHVYVMKKESEETLRVEFIGAIDDSPRDMSDVDKTYVADAVNALLAGEKPSTTTARAIGCTIKWKQS